LWLLLLLLNGDDDDDDDTGVFSCSCRWMTITPTSLLMCVCEIDAKGSKDPTKKIIENTSKYENRLDLS
jgi:hypothetical protein